MKSRVLNRILNGQIVGATLLGLMLLPSMTWASPIVTVSVTARPTGSGDPYVNLLAVKPGESLDYQVSYQLAEVGTVNSNLPLDENGNREIGSWIGSADQQGDGLNSLAFSLNESLNAPIQANFPPHAQLTSGTGDNPNWSAGTGAKSGVQVNRGNGDFDLQGGFAIAASGQFYGLDDSNTPTDTQIATGSFVVGSPAFDGKSIIQLGVLPNPAIHPAPTLDALLNYHDTKNLFGDTTDKTSFFFPISAQSGPDPLIAFNDLTLVPEPSSLLMAAVGVLGLGVWGLRRRSTRTGQITA